MDTDAYEEKVFAEIKKSLLYLPDVLVDLVISLHRREDDEVDRQCSGLYCSNPISRKAFFKFNRTECIICRVYIERGASCGFRYNNGVICKQKYMDYHHHCDKDECDGALYCETCSQCPVCDPCH